MERSLSTRIVRSAHYGHIDIVERALGIFDKVVLAIAHDTSKRSLFTVEERMDLARRVF